MGVSKFTRSMRYIKAFPRWFWNNHPTNALCIAVFGIPSTMIFFYRLNKYGWKVMDEMPHYRPFYTIVRPDDPRALEGRTPEEYPSEYESNRVNRWPTSYWRDYGFGYYAWKD